MSQKRKVYDKKFRSKVALEAIREQMTLAEIARKYTVIPISEIKYLN
jgi:transposase-like protein